MKRTATLVPLLVVAILAARAEQPVESDKDELASDDGITAERLDRAVEYILSQDPPLMCHGSLYGSCPDYVIPGTNICVMCVGFWEWGVDRNPYDKCRTLLVREENMPTGRGFEVEWTPDGEVVIDQYRGVWKIATAPKPAKELVSFVLDKCDRPCKTEGPTSGNQFWDYLSRQILASGKRHGFHFGDTNRCDRPWAVPTEFTVADETYRIPGYQTRNGVMMTAQALDASSNTVAYLRVVRQSTEFAAGYELFHEFGWRHDWGDTARWRNKKVSTAEYDSEFFFVEPPLDSGYQNEDKHLYAVWHNIYVELHAERNKREIAKALVLAGVAAGTNETQRAKVVSDRPNAYDLLDNSPIRREKK